MNRKTSLEGMVAVQPAAIEVPCVDWQVEDEALVRIWRGGIWRKPAQRPALETDRLRWLVLPFGKPARVSLTQTT